METYSWKSEHGFETVIAEPVLPEPPRDSVAVRWHVIALLSGEMYPAYDLAQAKELGHLLAEKWQQYAREYTVERDPSEMIRDGYIVSGLFAGLPVEYRDGVAGVYLFGEWTKA